MKVWIYKINSFIKPNKFYFRVYFLDKNEKVCYIYLSNLPSYFSKRSKPSESGIPKEDLGKRTIINDYGHGDGTVHTLLQEYEIQVKN